jgi:hypothetical protein
MRVYALLLATLVTAASGYILERAAASAGLHRAAWSFDPTPIWYGGMLRPVTVEAYRAPRPALAATPAGVAAPRARGLE